MDYKNGKIYKVICSETQQVYIGSTCSTLTKRLYGHKHKKNKCKSKTFIEPKIFLIEDFPCDRKEQLYARERYHIENSDCVNIMFPGRTYKEYYETNKHKKKLVQKIWREKNIKKIKEVQKEWYIKNADISIKRSKEYRDKNKKEISDKRKVKINCECGSIISKKCLPEHERSKKHQAFISQSK